MGASDETITGGEGDVREDAALPGGSYELSSYEPVSFELAPRPEVTDEQVETQLEMLAESKATGMVASERTEVEDGDDILVDVEVTCDGKPVEALTATGRICTLGDGSMPADFDAHLVGATVGQQLEFDFTAPSLTGAGIQTYHACVTVDKVMRKDVPPVDDEWVRHFLPKMGTAANLRAAVRQQLQANLDAQYEQQRSELALAELDKRFDGLIDDESLQKASANVRMRFDQQAHAQGVSLQEFLKEQGLDQQQFSLMVMAQARSMLRQGHALDAWARHYGLSATDEDMRKFAAQTVPPEKVDSFMSQLEITPGAKDEFARATLRTVALEDVLSKAQIFPA